MSKRKQNKQPDESVGEDGKKQRKRWKPPLKVPPPDCTVWPEQYRGDKWKPVYAILFGGRCQMCAYSCPLPKSRQILDKIHGQYRLLLCTNHPSCPGELCEVLPIETCRNFEPKRWRTPCRQMPEDARRSTTDECDPTIRRIPLGKGFFATVDADDYEMLSEYRWYITGNGSNNYAAQSRDGRMVYMHRLLMQPPKGYVVDHIDGNGLNNRRCNLRVCTPAQNMTNKAPRGGTSKFTGVYRCRKKWVAQVSCRGTYHYVGLFDDEVEAAKARDRKAYELHGEYAYLNFPDEIDR